MSWADNYDLGRANRDQMVQAQGQLSIQQGQLAVSQGHLSIAEERLEWDRDRQPILDELDRRRLDLSELQMEISQIDQDIRSSELDYKNAFLAHNKELFAEEIREKTKGKAKKQYRLGENFLLAELKRDYLDALENNDPEAASRYDKYYKKVQKRDLRHEDWTALLLDTFDDEQLENFLFMSGIGESVLTDYGKDGMRIGENKRLVNFTRSPDGTTFTAQVMSEGDEEGGTGPRISPVTEGGQNYADGGTTIPELDAASLGVLVANASNLYHEPRSAFLANAAQDDPAILSTVEGAGINLLEMGRPEKEELLLNQVDEKMKEAIARDLYETLGPQDDDVVEADAIDGVKINGSPITGTEQVLNYVDTLFSPKLVQRETKLIVQGFPVNTYSSLAANSILDQYPAYNDYVHVDGQEFSLSPDQLKWLPEDRRAGVRHDSIQLAEAAAAKKIKNQVMKGDIGHMISSMNTVGALNKYVENKLINGKTYSKDQALIMYDFWNWKKAEGVKEKLATSPFYMKEFTDLGPAEFALKYGQEDSDFNRIAALKGDKQSNAAISRDLGQIKQFLSTEHGIDMPVAGPNGLVAADLVAFRTQLNDLDIPVEKLNEIDQTVAKWADIIMDRNDQTLNAIWIDSPRALAALGSLTYSLLDNPGAGDLDQMLDFAYHGVSSSVLGDSINAAQLQQNKAQIAVNLINNARNKVANTEAIVSRASEHGKGAIKHLVATRNTEGYVIKREAQRNWGPINENLAAMDMEGERLLTTLGGNINHTDFQNFLNVARRVQKFATQSWVTQNKENKFLSFLYGKKPAGGYTTTGSKGAYLAIDGNRLTKDNMHLIMTGIHVDPQKLKRIDMVGVADSAGKSLGAEGSFYSYHNRWGDTMTMSFIQDAIITAALKE